MEKQVLESPFTKKDFLKLIHQFSEPKDIKFEDFAISNSTIINIGNRDFVDYRPSVVLDIKMLEDNNIKKIDFDSLHFFQIRKLINSNNLIISIIHTRMKPKSIDIFIII